MPPKTPASAINARTSLKDQIGSASDEPVSVITGSAPNADQDPMTLSASHGSIDSNSLSLTTSAHISAPMSCTSVHQAVNSASSEPTNRLKPWLVTNGLPLALLEARAQARGISLDRQVSQMIQYCLDNGINGD